MPNTAGDGTFVVYTSAGTQDLLTSVTDGMHLLDPTDPGFRPSVSITYDNLIDAAKLSGIAESSESAQAATYLART